MSYDLHFQSLARPLNWEYIYSKLLSYYLFKFSKGLRWKVSFCDLLSDFLRVNGFRGQRIIPFHCTLKNWKQIKSLTDVVSDVAGGQKTKEYVLTLYIWSRGPPEQMKALKFVWTPGYYGSRRRSQDLWVGSRSGWRDRRVIYKRGTYRVFVAFE